MVKAPGLVSPGLPTAFAPESPTLTVLHGRADPENDSDDCQDRYNYWLFACLFVPGIHKKSVTTSAAT